MWRVATKLESGWKSWGDGAGSCELLLPLTDLCPAQFSAALGRILEEMKLAPEVPPHLPLPPGTHYSPTVGFTQFWPRWGLYLNPSQSPSLHGTTTQSPPFFCKALLTGGCCDELPVPKCERMLGDTAPPHPGQVWRFSTGLGRKAAESRLSSAPGVQARELHIKGC